jgi:hypothetical protein
MEKKERKSRLARVPAWLMSLVTLVVIVAIMIIINDPKSTSLNTIQITGWIFSILLLTAACFVICRTHPKSVWYTPAICNAVGIIGLISNTVLTLVLPDYGTSLSEWIILASAFVFSITAAMVGASIGRRSIIQPT